ncbi:MAG: AAA family ATPase [Acidobacteria bacterium]|nr:AAA family ATPase [Acidobacteriota bacterium]
MKKLHELPGFRQVAKNQYEARCPGHEDKRASLSIGLGTDGKILLDCKAGCKTDTILQSLGLSMRDLFPENNGNGHHPERQIIATYDYRTTDGTLSYQVVRFEPKDFRQRKPDGAGGWIWNAKGLKRLPYNLPEIDAATEVFIVEGEKDVESLRKIGLTATCIAGGAKSPDWPTVSQYFRADQHITIIPDNDGPGEGYQANAGAALCGKVASIKVLRLEGLPEKGDVSDWLVGRDPEAAAEELSRLSEAAPEWQPAESNPEQAVGFQPPAHWQLYDVADRFGWKCPDLEPVIEGILAKGNLLWLAAETQTGKTLFMLWVCLHLLNKGTLFDRFAVTPVKKILYVACEDPARRFKARLLDMTDAAIEAGRFVVYVAPGLSIFDSLCFLYLEEMVHDGGFDLLVIDTFQATTMGVSSFDDEKLSVVIRRLLDLTRRLGTTVIVNDHFRKTQQNKKRVELDSNDVKGSGGKLQNADAYLLMDRQNGKLRVVGKSKEWDRPIGFLLDISAQGSTGKKFTYAGDLDQMANDMKKMGEENKYRVLEAYDFSEWRSRADVADRISMSASTVAKHTAVLLKNAELEQQGIGRNTKYRRLSSDATVRSEDTPRTNNHKGLYDNN